MRNGERAERAALAVAAYRNSDGQREPDEADVRDLLCDLQHYCHREGIPFQDELLMGISNFEDESGEIYNPPILTGPRLDASEQKDACAKAIAPCVAIIVEGGVVQEVISPTPCEYILIDHDNLEQGEDLDFTPIACDVQDLEGVIADVREQYSCRKCGKPNNDGEGYDGLCGNCADKAERKAKP